jgi:hypothetical protein
MLAAQCSLRIRPDGESYKGDWSGQDYLRISRRGRQLLSPDARSLDEMMARMEPLPVEHEYLNSGDTVGKLRASGCLTSR